MFFENSFNTLKKMLPHWWFWYCNFFISWLLLDEVPYVLLLITDNDCWAISYQRRKNIFFNFVYISEGKRNLFNLLTPSKCALCSYVTNKDAVATLIHSLCFTLASKKSLCFKLRFSSRYIVHRSFKLVQFSAVFIQTLFCGNFAS